MTYAGDGRHPSPLDTASLGARVEKALEAFLSLQRPRLTDIDAALLPVAESLESFVLGGGKRMRPAFAYWGYRGAGGVDSEQVVACVSSLELLQASALIHDDLIDASDTRRGEPSLHRRFEAQHSAHGWSGGEREFGAAAAILLGDLCLAWSDELYCSSGMPVEAIMRARPLFDAMRTEVMAGQYLDVLAQAARDTTIERASKVARYKSAKYTVERPLMIGAALAGAPRELIDAYSAYGLPLGEAFQLRDDVLGVFGDPARTGKPAGDDLREGKRTYLIAAAYETASPAQRELLDRWLGDPGLTAEAVAGLRDVITDTGALARTEERITRLAEQAAMALAGANVDAAARPVLEHLATAAIQRVL